MRTLTVLAVAALGLGLGACATGSSHSDGTTIFGGVFGGFLGTRVGQGGFSSGGAASERSISRRLDSEDRRRMHEAEQRAYHGRVGETVAWSNAASGHSGTVTTSNEHRRTGGDSCREVESEVTVAGRKETGYGIACQQPDGSWKIVS